MGSSNKRKGNALTGTHAVVVVDNDSDDSFLSCKHKLAMMRASYSAEQSTTLILQQLAALQQHASSFDASSLVEQGENVLAVIENEINAKTSQVHQESQQLFQLQVSLNNLLAERTALQQELEAADQNVHALHDEISHLLETTECLKKDVEELMESQQAQVLHLKHKISLFANCSRIKWNYDNPEQLQGDVVRCMDYSFLLFHKTNTCPFSSTLLCDTGLALHGSRSHLYVGRHQTLSL